MISTLETIPTPLLPRPLSLDALPLRPAVRRWARATVRELQQVVPRLPHRPRRRLLALFVDGLGARILARAAAEGTMPFLARLRDERAMCESRAFSGMPSTTTAFQAGLFYGLRHPDVPAFNWLDRERHEPVMMNRPQDALQVEERLRKQAGAGLMAGGASYLSILRGGADDRLNTAGAGAILGRQEVPVPQPTLVPGMLQIHRQTALALGARLALETGPFLWEMGRFVRQVESRRHEGNFLLNHLLVGTLLKEVAQGQAIVDLVRGVPRIFLNFHDFDEVSHRRGPDRAEAAVLRGIDRSIEAMFAIAAAVDDPPDVWVFSDHGQIPSEPFEKHWGCTFAEWVRGAGDGGGPPPTLPRSVEEAVGTRPSPHAPFPAAMQVADCGNYAHVYLERGAPLDARAVVERHGRTLARLLACPGVGLALLRHGDGAIAFAGSRRVVPDDPATVPAGVSPRAVRAAMDDLVHSPAAGDVLVYGAWRDGSCISLSWEWSSHGGPSHQETETFVIHPTGLPFDPAGVEHAADLHAAFRALYDG